MLSSICVFRKSRRPKRYTLLKGVNECLSVLRTTIEWREGNSTWRSLHIVLLVFLTSVEMCAGNAVRIFLTEELKLLLGVYRETVKKGNSVYAYWNMEHTPYAVLVFVYCYRQTLSNWSFCPSHVYATSKNAKCLFKHYPVWFFLYRLNQRNHVLGSSVEEACRNRQLVLGTTYTRC
jgi:hypothetical protein